jgi:hypothetical protein
MGRPNTYATIHDTSFIPHQVEPFSAPKVRTQKTVIYNTSVTESERDSHFTTIVSDTYRGIDAKAVDRSFKPSVSQKTGSSHIRFGQTNEDASKTESSVTKRDYKPTTITERVKLEKPSLGGIRKAIKPGDAVSIQSHTQSIFKGDGPKHDLVPAGIVYEIEKQTPTGELSAVPTGDGRYYDMGSCQSTSNVDFVNYPWTGPPSFPILGANMTKSKVFSHIEADYVPNYTTTTQTEFVAYSPVMAKLTRGNAVNPYAVTQRIGGHEIMETETTQHAHFKSPGQMGKRIPILPHVALPNRLFPLCKGGHRYETTTNEYFNNRVDLYFKKSDSLNKVK